MKMTWLVAAAVAVVAVTGEADAGFVTSGEIVARDLDGQGDSLDWSIDRITFSVTAGTTVNFDALGYEFDTDLNGDGEITVADLQMNLYTGSGTFLQLHDDGPLGSDGSISNLDGNFSYFFSQAGTYFISLSALLFTPGEGLLPYREDLGANYFVANFDHFDWQVTLSATNGTISDISVRTLGNPATPNPGVGSAVPEPASLALMDSAASACSAAGIASGGRLSPWPREPLVTIAPRPRRDFDGALSCAGIWVTHAATPDFYL